MEERHIEHNIEDFDNKSNLAYLAFLGMLLTPIPRMNILGKYDSETQIKMLENSLSDNELKTQLKNVNTYLIYKTMILTKINIDELKLAESDITTHLQNFINS